MPRKRRYKAILQSPEGRSFGQVDRTGKLFWSGEYLEDAGANKVGYVVRREGVPKKEIEKRYFRHFSHPDRDFSILVELQKAGVKTVPEFRLVITKNEKGMLERSLVMTDLTERGKKEVFSSNQLYKNTKVRAVIQGLKNYSELVRQMDSDVRIAGSHGYWGNGDNWLFAIDKRKNTGEIFFVDVDSLHPRQLFYGRAGGFELKRAGVSTAELQESIKKLESIRRRSDHSLSSIIVSKASKKVSSAIKDSIQRMRSPILTEIEKSYRLIIGIALEVQIRGVPRPKSGWGLTKDERKTIFRRIHGKGKTAMAPDYNDLIMAYRAAIRNILEVEHPDRIYRHDFRRKVRMRQEDHTGIGRMAANVLSAASKRVGRKLFAFDVAVVKSFEGRLEDISSKSPAEIRRFLDDHPQELTQYLAAKTYRQLQEDLSTIAMLRIKRDLSPYNDAGVKTFLASDRKRWMKDVGLTEEMMGYGTKK
jgi:hypothetical protein